MQLKSNIGNGLAKDVDTLSAVAIQHRQLFVYLAVHRKMGRLAKDFDTLSAVMGFNPK